MEAVLQRVFEVTTLCMDTRSQSFPLLVSGLIHDALLQSSPRLNEPMLKMTFLTFPRYSSYNMWVRWANLQPSNVKFFRDGGTQCSSRYICPSEHSFSLTTRIVVNNTYLFIAACLQFIYFIVILFSVFGNG